MINLLYQSLLNLLFEWSWTSSDLTSRHELVKKRAICAMRVTYLLFTFSVYYLFQFKILQGNVLLRAVAVENGSKTLFQNLLEILYIVIYKSSIPSINLIPTKATSTALTLSTEGNFSNTLICVEGVCVGVGCVGTD